MGHIVTETTPLLSDDIPLLALIAGLVILVILSGFFSSSETGMMALNRYKLRHLVKKRHKGACRASELLERPDRLIGLILLGNNFVNILASTVMAIIAWRIFGEAGLALAPLILTPIILIFAEVAPKTYAAYHPERLAFPAAVILKPLLKLCYPIVAAINWVTNGLLTMLRIAPPSSPDDELDSEMLRTVVNEAGAMISTRYQHMLNSVLDLQSVTVDDIMIPRNEINGIDLDDPQDDIVEQILHSQHTRLPVFNSDVNNTVGMLHLRKFIPRLHRHEFSSEAMLSATSEPYFVPLGTPLSTQLRNFQRQHERVGLVVDEYGDIQGLITLDDLLEEIVGEFTTDAPGAGQDVHPQQDGTFLVDASATVRELNRSMAWELPTTGPKTLNGLILESLEDIPEPGTSLLIAGYPVEIVQTTDSRVKMARVNPSMRQPVADLEPITDG